MRRHCAGLLAALVVSLAGCGGGVDREANRERAQQALTTALDAWKQGASDQELRGADPAIVVGDADWRAGRKLVDYRVASDNSFDGRNLRAPVSLLVQAGPGAKPRRIDTRYIVGSDKVLTVIRESE